VRFSTFAACSAALLRVHPRGSAPCAGVGARGIGTGEGSAWQGAAMAMHPPESATNATDFKRTLAAPERRAPMLRRALRRPSFVSLCPVSRFCHILPEYLRVLSLGFGHVPLWFPPFRRSFSPQGISASFESLESQQLLGHQ
jgi:hypothetical protein